MKLLDIVTVQEDEKYLRQQSKPVDIKDIDTPKFQEFVDDLIYTAVNAKLAPGWITAGLAAIQVKNPINMFILKDIDDDGYKVYINPEYEIVGDACSKGLEGCLSIPNTTAKVVRAKKIKIRYLDRFGKKHKEKLTGWDARIFLHEYDHLIGVLFTDLI